ncbi:hypothetical protein Pmar_PMAR021702 [Perkinsus marinus ATCC 50983]|uniref:Fibronectin type-III domain-containing protein n=1 Tax=Perkinsus marinus (strain ATCC 50983 / TXsc) TaxID=423536 RepID=C5L2F9_PERM5|nr:hypothetical protein Pmar_PMAR021702 [Perkinsus marinus ATCC 50983]EER09053.1 hypothetical protein Pmar_PMAR021702 [Perkinsus marinus ATCC 50983]|eukprot:XP_002777237.1 hypothetical protein Pmar_PMAR021702 [Perkinsus marinus ATCC 50983]
MSAGGAFITGYKLCSTSEAQCVAANSTTVYHQWSRPTVSANVTFTVQAENACGFGTASLLDYLCAFLG